MSITQLTELLGWASFINLAFLCVASLMLVVLKEQISELHAKLFNIDQKTLALSYFSFLSHYKVLTLVFFVAPYFALTLIE